MVYCRKGYRLRSAAGEMHRQRQGGSKSGACRCPVALGSRTALTSPGNTAWQHALSTARPRPGGLPEPQCPDSSLGRDHRNPAGHPCSWPQSSSAPPVHWLLWVTQRPHPNHTVGVAQSPHSELGCYSLAGPRLLGKQRHFFFKVRHSEGLEVNFQEPRTKARPFSG